ncbi:MAG: hypothetical protein WAO52_09180 [Prolixibacteraceae bacterium]
MPDFLAISTGLKDQHQKKNPLYEKMYFAPGSSSTLTSRLYDDGSLYYLSDIKLENTTGQFWIYISSVSENGMQLIHHIIESFLNLTEEIPVSGNSAGSVIWKFYFSGKIHETVVTGIPYGKFRILTEIDDAINANIKKIFNLNEPQ